MSMSARMALAGRHLSGGTRKAVLPAMPYFAELTSAKAVLWTAPVLDRWIG